MAVIELTPKGPGSTWRCEHNEPHHKTYTSLFVQDVYCKVHTKKTPCIKKELWVFWGDWWTWKGDIHISCYVCVLFVCSIMPGACYSLPILICHSAFPPFWSWVKYLNSYLMNCQHILVERLAVTRWWIPLTLMISRPFKWHPYESDNLTVFISFFGGGLSRFVTHHHDVRGFSQGCLWSTGFSSCATGTSIFLIIV